MTSYDRLISTMQIPVLAETTVHNCLWCWLDGIFILNLADIFTCIPQAWFLHLDLYLDNAST